MKKIIVFSSVLFVALVFITCASLTPGGEKVKYATKKEAPDNCEEIGEVSVGEGLSMGASSVEQVKIILRNKTAEMGGNFLVIDTVEHHSDQNSSWYSSTGRAYKCP